jgi:iron complex outermembrane recepter protein
MQVSRRFRKVRSGLVLPFGVVAAMQAQAVHAQTAAAAPQSAASAAAAVNAQTVTVTAQKRAEKPQDVPTAITVITSTDIERAGINNIQDAAALTPNLVITDQLRPGIQTVSFRGFTTVQGGQSPFAIVVDGVPEPGQEFLKQSFVDVAQIEVLRGPQGTLYGAGAIAGAINIVTVPPSDTVEGRIKLGYAQGNDKTETFSISGPLAKGVAWYRFGINRVDEDGQITDTTTHTKVDQSHETSLNGELLFKPSSRLAISLRASGTDGKNGALWLVPVSDADFNSNFGTGPNTDIVGKDTRRLQTYSAKVDYTFDPFTLTSITAYSRADQFLYADGDFSSAPIAGQTWTDNTRAISQEFRLTSPGDGPLRWNAGVFVQKYTIDDTTQFGAVQPDGSVLYPAGGNTVTDTVDRSAALFGQASYDIGQFTLTGGLRYDSVHAQGDDPGTGWNAKHTFSELQPKATLAYKWNPALMSYATWSKGFRTGGFNADAPDVGRLYQNETAKNFEVGTKSSWLDNTLTLDGSLFHTKFNNQQLFTSLATDTGIYRIISNIPETTVNGAEIELDWRATSWFKASTSAGYNNTKIGSDGIYSGNRTPQVYGFTSNVGLEFQHPVASSLFVARLDWNHRGDVYWDMANDLRTPPKNFFNTRIALESGPNLAWQLALVGKNITNERTPAAVGADALGTGASLRNANEPRQWGVEVAYRF